MESLDELDLQFTGLQWAEAETTPGWQFLHVLDLRTNRLVNEAVRVDCRSGQVWERLVAGGRAHPRHGKFAIIATLNIIKEYKDAWKLSE